MTFALYFGNRGFFPGELIASARDEVKAAVEKLGHNALMLDFELTRNGGVETADEGRIYANFLKEHQGQYDGVILSLPNFGDENGAIAALRDCGVPILIQAYPDEFGKMDFEHRRDSFCGKFSVMDVFYQYGLAYTIFPPHTVHPSTPAFEEQLLKFAAVCRIVNKMRRFTIGAIGARTTKFKTVRFDELTLERNGISVDALDLSEVFYRVRKLDEKSGEYSAKADALRSYCNWGRIPEGKFAVHVKTSVVLDQIVKERHLNALALRCWEEFQTELGIAPCVLIGELNNRGMVTACEMDVGNAVPMYALHQASQVPATCLDWNNNYPGDDNKCILFHCGPIPRALMTDDGQVTDHKMFAKGGGAGCGWGSHEGRIAASPMTFASAKTEDGKIFYYSGEGRFTTDPIEPEFFGCGGVCEIPDLQKKLITVGRNGFKHHVGATFGLYEEALDEAFTTYLGYEKISL